MRPLCAVATQNSKHIVFELAFFSFFQHLIFVGFIRPPSTVFFTDWTAQPKYRISEMRTSIRVPFVCVSMSTELSGRRRRALCTFPFLTNTFRWFVGQRDGAWMWATNQKLCKQKQKRSFDTIYFPCVALTVHTHTHNVLTIFVANKARHSHSTRNIISHFPFHFLYKLLATTQPLLQTDWQACRQANGIELHNVIRANHYNGINANIRNCNNNNGKNSPK